LNSPRTRSMTFWSSTVSLSSSCC